MNVTFYGVRGSTPCPCEANRRYGANTACVALEVPGEDPIVFDIGTGLRFWGETLPTDGSFRGTALVTHMHWDHVQGLPFFVPVDRPGARLDIYGPTQDEGSLAEVFNDLMKPPYFPVRAAELRARPVDRDEERQALHVVPVHVRDQRGAAERPVLRQLLAPEAQTGTDVEDDRVLAGGFERDAGSVAAIAHVLGARAGRRTPHPVKGDVDHGPPASVFHHVRHHLPGLLP